MPYNNFITIVIFIIFYLLLYIKLCKELFFKDFYNRIDKINIFNDNFKKFKNFNFTCLLKNYLFSHVIL